MDTPLRQATPASCTVEPTATSEKWRVLSKHRRRRKRGACSHYRQGCRPNPGAWVARARRADVSTSTVWAEPREAAGPPRLRVNQAPRRARAYHQLRRWQCHSACRSWRAARRGANNGASRLCCSLGRPGHGRRSAGASRASRRARENATLRCARMTERCACVRREPPARPRRFGTGSFWTTRIYLAPTREGRTSNRGPVLSAWRAARRCAPWAQGCWQRRLRRSSRRAASPPPPRPPPPPSRSRSLPPLAPRGVGSRRGRPSRRWRCPRRPWARSRRGLGAKSRSALACWASSAA
jgi:hypothetical protein